MEDPPEARFAHFCVTEGRSIHINMTAQVSDPDIGMPEDKLTITIDPEYVFKCGTFAEDPPASGIWKYTALADAGGKSDEFEYVVTDKAGLKRSGCIEVRLKLIMNMIHMITPLIKALACQAEHLQSACAHRPRLWCWLAGEKPGSQLYRYLQHNWRGLRLASTCTRVQVTVSELFHSKQATKITGRPP